MGPSVLISIKLVRSFVSVLDGQVSGSLSTSSHRVERRLFGLERAESAVASYLRDFSLNCLYGSRLYDAEMEHGILLYGLPGCGKRSLLKNICQLNNAKDEVRISTSSHSICTLFLSVLVESRCVFDTFTCRR